MSDSISIKIANAELDQDMVKQIDSINESINKGYSVSSVSITQEKDKPIEIRFGLVGQDPATKKKPHSDGE